MTLVQAWKYEHLNPGVLEPESSSDIACQIVADMSDILREYEK